MLSVRIALRLFLFLAFIFAVSVPAWAQSGSDIGRSDNPIAAMTPGTTGVTWSPHVEYSSLVLTVSTPGGDVLRKEFPRGANPTFNLIDKNGNRRPDGQYVYELRLVPVVSQQARDALKASREDGNSKAVVQELQMAGQLPLREVVQSGSFVIYQGAIVSNTAAETPATASKSLSNTTEQKATTEAAPPIDDVVTPDDQIIQGSLCVGFDCVDNESFGFDTIRLKENNTRISFIDTSTTAGRATRDWRLRANESADGGLNAFFIDDMGDTSNGSETPSSTPFTIRAGAPTNSIFLDSNGKLGLRTATPMLDIHMNTTDTPAIRLEQNNSGGFTPQTWDIGGNESNFFVRDLTGGSRLVFRIRPGAPTSSLDIAASGNVGFGTGSPTAKMDVVTLRADGNASGVRISDADNPVNNVPNPLANLYNSAGVGQLDLFNATAGQDVQIKAGGISFFNGGNVGIGTSSPAFKLDVAGAVNATSYNVNGVPLNTSSLVSGAGTTNRIVKWTDGPNRVLADSVIAESGGNVGIGTTSPGQRLHVAAPIGAYSPFRIDGNGGATGMFFINTAATDGYIGNAEYAGSWKAKSTTASIIGYSSSSGQAFSVYGNTGLTAGNSFSPTELLRVTTSGNVGIGTTTPQSTLQVNGYVQLALTAGAPPATDCDSASEYGRMKVDATGNKLYVCTSTGWKSTALVP